MGAAILDNDVFRACHRKCFTIGPLRKASSLTSLNDWSVEQTSCLTALNHWSVEERIPTRMGSCLVNLFKQKKTCKITQYAKSFNLITMSLKSSLILIPPIATKVVCFSRLLNCLRSLYGKQCGPRTDCSYRSSLFWVHAVCFYT